MHYYLVDRPTEDLIKRAILRRIRKFSTIFQDYVWFEGEFATFGMDIACNILIILFRIRMRYKTVLDAKLIKQQPK